MQPVNPDPAAQTWCRRSHPHLQRGPAALAAGATPRCGRLTAHPHPYPFPYPCPNPCREAPVLRPPHSPPLTPPLPLPLPRPLPRAAGAGGRGRRGAAAAPPAGSGKVGSPNSASISLICRSGRSWTTLPASAACQRQPSQY